MKTCERVDSLTSAYLEREASPAEMKFVDGHLTVCPRCRESIDQVARLVDQLAVLPRSIPAADFTERVLARTRGLKPAGLEEPIVIPIRPWWNQPAVLAAAAALVAALLSVGVWQGLPGRHPQSANTETPAQTPGFASRTPQETVSAPVTPPVVTNLGEIYPDLKEEGQGTSIGMSRDAYVSEEWMLRQPAGGGTATLTRAGVDPSTPVTVTF